MIILEPLSARIKRSGVYEDSGRHVRDYQSGVRLDGTFGTFLSSHSKFFLPSRFYMYTKLQTIENF